MKCSKCGIENKEGSLFCKSCGSDLDKNGKSIVDTNRIDFIQDMDICLAETSRMVEILYEKFETIKKEYNSKSDINANEIIALKSRKEQLEKENKILKEQTTIQQERIEELKRQLQNGVTCPKCNKYYKEKVMFCSECGTKLG